MIPSPVRDAVRSIASIVRRVIGVPDYERYVAHIRDHHPGEHPMSREAFARERMHSRYDKPGGRCC